MHSPVSFLTLFCCLVIFRIYQEKVWGWAKCPDHLWWSAQQWFQLPIPNDTWFVIFSLFTFLWYTYIYFVVNFCLFHSLHTERNTLFVVIFFGLELSVINNETVLCRELLHLSCINEVRIIVSLAFCYMDNWQSLFC